VPPLTQIIRHMKSVPPESNGIIGVDLFEIDSMQTVVEVDIQRVQATVDGNVPIIKHFDDLPGEIDSSQNAVCIGLGPISPGKTGRSQAYLVQSIGERVRLRSRNHHRNYVWILVPGSGDITLFTPLETITLSDDSAALVSGSDAYELILGDKKAVVLIVKVRVSPTWSHSRINSATSNSDFENLDAFSSIRQLGLLLTNLYSKKQLAKIADQFIVPAVHAIEQLLDATFTPARTLQLEHQSRGRYNVMLDALDDLVADADCSIELLAIRCGYSTRTVQRIFAENEDTFSKSVRNARISKAIKLLELSSESIDESVSTSSIAVQVGYRSSAAFSRAFKLVTGIAPSQWYRR